MKSLSTEVEENEKVETNTVRLSSLIKNNEHIWRRAVFHG